MLPSATIPVKDKYKVKNWKAYNQSLVQRGQLTIWLEDSELRAWRDIDTSKKVVGENLYADCVIQCCLLLGYVYHQNHWLGVQSIDHDGACRLCHTRLYYSLSATGLFARRSESSLDQQSKTRPSPGLDRFESIWRRGMESAKTWGEQAANLAEVAHWH